MTQRIIFIEPPYGKFIEQLDAPFPLMYLAAVAEQCGWEASIVDMRTIADALPDADIHAVTSSSPQFPEVVQLERRLQLEFPNSLRILGGNHISSEPDDIKKTWFHLGVIGEGEFALRDILSEYARCLMMSRRTVKGMPVENLDDVPFPARHLIDWSHYKRGIFWGKDKLADAVSIISSRGCPQNCCYCGSHVVFGRKTRFRSIPNVITEVKEVIDTMGYHGFNFHDDQFTLNRDRTIALSHELEKCDVVWRCLARADRIDETLLTAMRRSGCKEIILGIESGSQRVLNRIRKGTTVKQNLRAMQLIKQSGIQLKVGIMVGNPSESKETVEETKALLKACPPDYWAVSVLTPFPGSALWNHPEQFGMKILTRDLTKYAMVTADKYRGNVVAETEEMTKEDIEQARDELIDLLLDISGPTYELKH